MALLIIPSYLISFLVQGKANCLLLSVLCWISKSKWQSVALLNLVLPRLEVLRWESKQSLVLLMNLNDQMIVSEMRSHWRSFVLTRLNPTVTKWRHWLVLRALTSWILKLLLPWGNHLLQLLGFVHDKLEVLSRDFLLLRRLVLCL